MTNARVLKNKIRSINNTAKITHTMEMIATAKSKVCRDRIESVQPYGDKLSEILSDLKQSAGGVGEDFPLLRKPEKIQREAVFVITANRGLCGGYNTNILLKAERYIAQNRAQGVETEIHMIGKKGISRFKYAGQQVEKCYTQFDDKPSFDEAEQVYAPILERFAARELDAVTLIFTHYMNAARQHGVVRRVLPIPEAAEGEDEGHRSSINFIFEPDPDQILNTLLPLSLKTQFFQALLEAATSEQIARRVAMKNATDNAEEMVKTYTQKYNRTRQAGITQEILEIIGGSVVA